MASITHVKHCPVHGKHTSLMAIHWAVLSLIPHKHFPEWLLNKYKLSNCFTPYAQLVRPICGKLFRNLVFLDQSRINDGFKINFDISLPQLRPRKGPRITRMGANKYFKLTTRQTTNRTNYTNNRGFRWIPHKNVSSGGATPIGRFPACLFV